MASGVIPFPRPRQRTLPFPRTPRLVTAGSERLLPWAVVSLLFITAVLNFYVFQVSVVATSSYELQRLERERDAWRARNEQLQLELSKARSLGWVEFEATQHLGMVRGEDSLYIRIQPDSAGTSPLAPAVVVGRSPSVQPLDEEDKTVPAEFALNGEASSESGRSVLAWLSSLFEH